MDCGLERDVLLPFKEQTAKVEAGKSYLVRMYVDKSGRLAVSMKIGKELQPIEGYEEGQDFVGTVYEFKRILVHLWQLTTNIRDSSIQVNCMRQCGSAMKYMAES